MLDLRVACIKLLCLLLTCPKKGCIGPLEWERCIALLFVLGLKNKLPTHPGSSVVLKPKNLGEDLLYNWKTSCRHIALLFTYPLCIIEILETAPWGRFAVYSSMFDYGLVAGEWNYLWLYENFIWFLKLNMGTRLPVFLVEKHQMQTVLFHQFLFLKNLYLWFHFWGTLYKFSRVTMDFYFSYLYCRNNHFLLE